MASPEGFCFAQSPKDQQAPVKVFNLEQ